MADFDDWRDAEVQKKYAGGSPRTVAPVEEPIIWWNPWTWDNSYLGESDRNDRDPAASEETGSKESDAAQGMYYGDSGEQSDRLDAIFGSGAELTPIEKHAVWLEERPGSVPSTIFGYDPADVRRSIEENTDAGVSLDNIMDLRDRALTEAWKGYYNLENEEVDPRLMYGRPIGPGLNESDWTDPANRTGSGRGGGRAAYVGPDRRVIEEYVGDKMIVLTGKRQPELQTIVDAYMNAAKQAFEGKEVDPKAEVLERIRGLAEYKRIHTLRGEGTDENGWVNRRQDRLEQLGMGSDAASARGIELAATGTALANMDVGKFQTARGRKDITLMNRIERTAKTIGGLL